MWFIGLLIGLILGGITGTGSGIFSGGILGLVCGLIYGERTRNKKQRLEERVAALEKLVRQLSTQIGVLGSVSKPGTQAKSDHKPVMSAELQTEDIAAASIPVEIHDTQPPVDLTNPFNKSAFSRPLQSVNPQISPKNMPAENAIEIPEWLSKLFKGNILAKIGVVILFFGIASGLKLAVDMGFFPISVRLTLGALAAISMGIFGYQHAQKPGHRMFGLALQGGSLGILYLLVYFMLARYQIIGEALAFVLFTVIGVICMLLATRQDGRSLAVLGISGAFLSPVMAASSGGSQITLFGYFLLLNIFIISVNWFKGWRELNISGFIFTLVIGMSWAFRNYQPSDFPVSETFLILFFLFYSATPVLFNILSAPGRLGWGDGMLLYGTPLAAATLQNHLMQGQDMALAWNACAAGGYYLMLWWLIYRRRNQETVWLEKSLLGIAIGFFTLAIPLAFGTQLTAAFWTLEGFGVLYLGVKQDRFLARLSGSALQILAGIYFFAHQHELQRSFPVFNDGYVGCLIVVIAALASSMLLQRTADEPGGSPKVPASAAQMQAANFSLLFLYWGLLWWFVSGFVEIDHFASNVYKMAEWLGLCIASFVFLEWLGTRRSWHAMRQPSALLLLIILVAGLDGYLKSGHVLSGIMSLLIPVALLTQYWLLYRHEHDKVPALCQLRHALSYWFLIVLMGSELAWVSEQLVPGNTLWPWLAWALVGAFGALVTMYGLNQKRWPFTQHHHLYLNVLQAPVFVLLCAWIIYGNLTHSGEGSGLPYLPVLNPFDLVNIFVMFVIWKWLRATHSPLMPALYGIVFLWVSAEAARLTHHWAGVPFEGHILLASSTLQAGLSFLWTAIAMGIMVYASRSKQRTLWFNGFGLLAIVGIKLMAIDLTNKGTVLWTFSLIGISLLIIAASYFSPAPPKTDSQG